MLSILDFLIVSNDLFSYIMALRIVKKLAIAITKNLAICIIKQVLQYIVYVATNETI